MKGHDQHKIGYKQSQKTMENTASASSMRDAVLMFRDMEGTLMSQVERLLFSLGVIPEEEFVFHGYSPDRLVELQPEFIAYKLSLSFKNLASFHANMEDDFQDKPDDLAKLIETNIPSAFAVYAANFQDKLRGQTLSPDQVHTQKLLNSVLDRIVAGRFVPIDSELALIIKSQAQPAPAPAPANRVQTDHTRLLQQVELMQKHESQTEAFLRENRDKTPPSSAFQPATRENAMKTNTKSTYIGIRPVQPKPSDSGVKDKLMSADCENPPGQHPKPNKLKAFFRKMGCLCC